jgi:two-component system, OmpR family, phosphate regulon response regulator PhoB
MTRILVVDDHPEVCELLKKTLTRRGHEIIVAGSGQDAVNLARDHRPDLILMDIMMPGEVSGTQATRILKSDPVTSRAKIIILTGKDGTKAIEEASEAGADSFFSKPFSPLELLQRLDEILG